VSVAANQRLSGTALDGIYKVTGTLPMFAEQGTWTLSYLALSACGAIS